MTIYYIDPVGGTNAGAGTSFATRKKTIMGFTAVAGDEVRYIASPAPYSLGTGAWVDGSEVITFGSLPVKALDEAGVNWTAAANVTCSLSTTRQSGANSQAFTPATAFTTGKMGYRTLPATLDLSAYDSISFIANANSGVTTAGLQLVLCSDATGDVPVETIPWWSTYTDGPGGANISLANQFWPIVYRKGSALPSVVNSIAVYATVDPGTSAITVDNIIATVEATGVTHKDVIGKNTVDEPVYYGISGITDTTVSIGIMGGSGMVDRPLTNQPYRGVSASLATYVQPTMQTMLLGADRTMLGTARLLRVSGGWDRTAMSSQTGQTYLMHSSPATTANAISTSGSTQELDHFSFVGYGNLGYAGATAYAHDNDFIGHISNSRYSLNTAVPADGNRHYIRYDVQSRLWTIGAAAASGFPDVWVQENRLAGLSTTGTGAIRMQSNASNGSADFGRPRIRIDKVSYSGRYGLELSDNVDIVNTTFTGNTSGDVLVSNSAQGGSVGLIGCSLPTVGFVSTTAGTGNGAELWDTDHIWRKGVTITNQSAVPPPINPKALEASISLSSWVSANRPGRVVLARIAAPAGTLSISAALRRNASTGSYAAIQVRAYSAPGITADQTSASPTFTAAWETKTISVTTSADSVIEVYGLYGGDSGTLAYFGDVTWS